MRVISGWLGGRQFDSPGTDRTHPMSDKVRGALFSVLGDIDGLTVLDAFAGTGALCFEAVSRGAISAVAIENDRAAQRVIARNIVSLDVETRVKLIRTSANAWLQTSVDTFDLVLCDPPYQDLQTTLLKRLAERVNQDGLMVLSWPTDQVLPGYKDFELLKSKTHGDATLAFYRRIL